MKVDDAIKVRSHLYTSSYSAQWTKGDDNNTGVVMKFMKSWENNSIDTSLISNWVYSKIIGRKRKL